MKKECIQYAEKLDSIGDLILSIGNRIKPVEVVAEEFSSDDFRVYENNLSDTIGRYEQAKESLATIHNVPSFVTAQHKQLVEQFGNFIESTRIMKNSVQLSSSDQANFNKPEYIRGYIEKEKSVVAIEKLTQQIGDILVKECK